MVPTSTVFSAEPEDDAERTSRDIKREAFVEAARESFLTRGYGATSMSSIAAAVGGSKTTLWSHFPSKEALFAAVVDQMVARYGRAMDVPLDPTEDIAESLRRYAAALMETVHSDPVIELHRLAIGNAGRFPELARTFYERGQARGKARLSVFLGGAMQMGKLRAGDPYVAARQFAGMLFHGSPQQHILSLTGAPSPAEIEAEIDLCVDSFMRAWKPD
ncbi:TetR/AcrR family transcriptional regulator [Sphingomonas sp. BGYR3]|uniref:TetR/AcrR family transcriptional regulator n=1 Tax=Sphingomonas sp. BGYR3 TaxID=2975483 RepID=UPI0021A666DF|nr:TetR/AcrR family transcriptional regulator [Sphingomonas sp. BGYR3]MDG5489824.1 TetR/AcrR family transcriptional regulator [Sphingomonas sp. BGYR3]